MPSNETNSRSQILQFVNCRILYKHEIIKEDLWVRDGKILNPRKLFWEEKGYADVKIDCHGRIIAPGFIDVQINGGLGVDFSSDPENLEEGLKKVAKGILKYGVTSFCPTIISSSSEMYKKILPKIKRTKGGSEGAGILGVHLEGPFISKNKKGAHPVENVIDEFPEGIKDLQNVYGELSDVSICTIAPELENTAEVVRELRNLKIKISVGHSMANLTQAEEAVQNGATFITHLFNAMLPFHHRDPGIVGLLTSDQIPEKTTVYYGMISDGIHTNPAALRIAHRAHPKGLVLVTDAIEAMGLKEGRHQLGTQHIEIHGNKAVVAGTDTLCGSIATLDMCIRHFKKASGCTTVEALEAATLHPALMLEISDQKGTLDYDTDADFVLLDDDLQVHSTYIGGQLVWTRSGDLKRASSHSQQ
ncbi:N-acetylglucosamine-6-phosphate deacetylase-like [Ptychodera flava]|uniref:N-acetylglucosamine-6-phosphate deacetylase-like n=1 Tax=Ptychodera flava TaxID=63121 RepID=UPI003969FEEB